MLRAAPSPKRKFGIRKPSTHHNADHRAWIRTRACLVSNADCRAQDVQCCHVREGTDGYLGGKPSDFWCWPGCFYHHTEQHNIGEKSFQAKYRLDLKAVALDFAWMSPIKATREAVAIYEARQQGILP